jgi:hypothetical protein
MNISQILKEATDGAIDEAVLTQIETAFEEHSILQLDYLI